MKKKVYVGNKAIGDGKITIQSMTNTPTVEKERTLEQILRLSEAGADFVRVSVPDIESAKAVSYLSANSPIPLIGDIHFSEDPALIAIENGIKKIRINPSNLSDSGLRAVVKKCAEYDIPIRVGVNKGSVKGKITPRELAELSLDAAKKIEDLGWDKLVLAVKTSNVAETVQAYRILSEKCDYPLHVGLTEAGIGDAAIIKSSIAIGALLLDGIGDTIRVSLTGDPTNEVYAAKKILRATGLDKNHVEIISCPTCARTCIDVEKIALRVEKLTENIEKPLKIAVMGCVVNGIGEGKDANFGISGGNGKSALFKGGEIYKTVENDRIEEELMKFIKEWNK